MAGVTEFNGSKETLNSKIRKRSGRIVNFEQSKISNAIYKALVATGKPDYPLAERLAARVVQKMIQQGEKTVVPSVEDVQDIVESILIEEGLSETAKAYILYRHERRKVRDEKMKILNKRDLDEVDKAFDINSLRVLAARYLLREYYNLMVSRDFLPNTPTLMNAGARLGQLSACFVLDMPDDMAGIMKASTDAAMIFKSGGGVGINYSDLRPEGDIVASTSGVASGPTSFMRIIDTITDVVKQGGKRRGANMGILEAWHPDVEKFVTAKTKPGVFENFNVSVGIWEDFWKVLVNKEGNHKYALRSPRTREPVRQIDAQQLIDLIALSAWKSAEPGVIFFDNINKYNPCISARQGPLRATNPCGEQSLYPYESCNLGSINLANFVKRKVDGKFEFDWQRCEQAIRLSTRFLDNVIDMNKYPVEEIKVATKETRRIGLGIMGIADLLFLLQIPYNSKDGYKFMNKLAEAVSYLSMDESVAIAKSRGPFQMFKDTDYIKGRIPVAGYYELPNETHTYDWSTLIEKINKHGIRNSWTSTIAPTGTLSMIADTANGIEPVFALVYEKRVTVGRFFYTDKVFENVLKENGLYSDEILTKIANNYGSIRGLPEIPEWMQRIFVTAIDIHWTDHVMAQGVWQKWISNAIAKTINMPGDVTAEDVKCAYLLSHELGLKGVTVFRDGSRHEQVLHITGQNTGQRAFAVKPSKYVVDYVLNSVKEPYVLEQMQKIFKESSVEDEKSVETMALTSQEALSAAKSASISTIMQHTDIQEDRCPTCNARLVITEGCNVCIECGFSGCGSG